VEFAVLVKVVPAAESAKFDPVRKTIRRDEGELFLNPFDQRALRVALDLRRPGETVTVVSMGPPSAASAVQETLALGVDRAILVSDPVLAGSDSLVTARVLERVLVEYPADLVLAGKWTTDSETGQVPAELAELLGRPLLTAARRLVRAPAADTFEVTVETETGSARATFAAPAVVSVGEKIAKPAKRAEDGTAVSSPGNLTRLDAALLGFAADEVGLPGSPTVVRALVDRAPRRTPVVFDGGTAEERVRGAVAALRGLLANPARGSGDPDLRRFDGPRSGTAFALVSDERGRLDRSALGTVSELRRIVPQVPVTALFAGDGIRSDERTAIGSAGAGSIVILSATAPVSARGTATAIGLVLQGAPTALAGLFPSTTFGREVAGRVAARLGLGLTGDAVSIAFGPTGDIRYVKPAFGGGILAEISSRTRPALATVRPGSFAVASVPGPVPLPESSGLAVTTDGSLVWVGRDDDPDDGLADPDAAHIVVSIGVGATAMLPQIRSASARWGAALVGTRRVVDSGVLPVARQVGLTGRWVAPQLGILLGVRGSPNHLIAWRRARVLLAVNPDRTAPVLAGVDVGIVGTCEEIVPLLLDAVPGLV
jgi:electron transfer flavoprotein alpha subunit